MPGRSDEARLTTVMAGRGDEALLRAHVPAIHVLCAGRSRHTRHARHKAGHDECECNLRSTKRVINVMAGLYVELCPLCHTRNPNVEIGEISSDQTMVLSAGVTLL
jgi:hypothetical protein